MAETAVDTFAGFAVVAPQLYECLGAQGVVGFDAVKLEKFHNRISLRACALKNGYGALGDGVVVGAGTIGIDERGCGVDYQDVDRSRAEGFKGA